MRGGWAFLPVCNRGGDRLRFNDLDTPPRSSFGWCACTEEPGAPIQRPKSLGVPCSRQTGHRIRGGSGASRGEGVGGGEGRDEPPGGTSMVVVNVDVDVILVLHRFSCGTQSIDVVDDVGPKRKFSREDPIS